MILVLISCMQFNKFITLTMTLNFFIHLIYLIFAHTLIDCDFMNPQNTGISSIWS